MQDLSLAKLDEVRAAIAAAKTFQEIKKTIALAEAAQVYAKQVKAGKDIEQSMAEYVIRAERKLGEMLKAAKAAGEIGRGKPFQKHNVDGDDIKGNLSDAGITRDLSSRAQQIAEVPEQEFEQKISDGKEKGHLSRSMFTKKEATIRRGQATPQLDKARGIVRGYIESRKPVSPHKLEQQHGISHVTFDMAITAELARKQALSETPEIMSDMLSLTAQQKLDAAIKQQKKKLQEQFEAAVATETDKRVRRYMEIASEKMAKEREEYRRVMEGRKGFMTREVYRDIRACLHPDRGTHPERFTASELQALYSYAFHEFSKLEKCILNEKESPTPKPPNLPRTMAEWEEMKRKVTAEKAARKNHPRSVTKAK